MGKEAENSRAQNMLVISMPKGSGSELKVRLKKLAERNHRSLSNMVTFILTDYMDNDPRASID